jgi:hypothetical protein
LRTRRRRELGLLRAFGYPQNGIERLLLAENLFLPARGPVTTLRSE